jgi:hypothetical protein
MFLMTSAKYLIPSASSSEIIACEIENATPPIKITKRKKKETSRSRQDD